MLAALVAEGVPGHTAATLAQLPPLGYLFGALLGSNPLGNLLGPGILDALRPDQATVLTSGTFFPRLIAGPFHHGLVLVLTLAAVMCAVAAVASWLRGGRFVHKEAEADDAPLKAHPQDLTVAPGQRTGRGVEQPNPRVAPGRDRR
jgi:hypothetical protein